MQPAGSEWSELQEQGQRVLSRLSQRASSQLSLQQAF